MQGRYFTDKTVPKQLRRAEMTQEERRARRIQLRRATGIRKAGK
jgi:hypothetical protein